MEDAQGLLYWVEVGEVIGRDFGKITRITEQGLEVDEFAVGDDDKVVRRPRHLRYGERPAISVFTRRQIFARNGSPQQAYDDALLEIAAFVRTFGATADLCTQVNAKTAAVARESFTAWRHRNGAVLAELQRHLTAQDEREREDFVEEKDKAGSQLDRSAANEALALKAQGPEKVLSFCNNLPSTLKSTRLYLETRFMSQLDLLRRCEKAGTCLDLVIDRD